MMALEDSSPAFSRASATTAFAKTMLVEPASKKVHTGLIPSGSVSTIAGKPDCLCSGVDGVGSYRSGQANVLYQGGCCVACFGGVRGCVSGQVIGHVKVEEGPMTPEVHASKPILVGMGWPKVDGSAVASFVEPAKSVIDLMTLVADLEGTVTTRATPKQISVALVCCTVNS